MKINIREFVQLLIPKEIDVFVDDIFRSPRQHCNVKISVFFKLKFNPLKNRSITNSYIYSHCFFFFEKQLFFLGFFKISKNRPKFERILLKFFIFNSPNCLRFQSIFMQSIFQKIQILKQVQNGPVNRDKKKR